MVTFVYPSIKAITLSNIKSIIALSTINHISLMYIILLINVSSLALFHILVHALFKSLASIIAGSLIHSSIHYQSIYKMKINNSFVQLIFLVNSFILILSTSKEGIIYPVSNPLSSTFVLLLLILGSLLSIGYATRLLFYIFNPCVIPLARTIRYHSLYAHSTLIHCW